jgi:predicted RNase H-like HicB family nuclease
MKKYLVEIFWSNEDVGYKAVVPDLPGCSAYGETMEEAAREIIDAQEAWLEACLASGEAIPQPHARARKAA